MYLQTKRGLFDLGRFVRVDLQESDETGRLELLAKDPSNHTWTLSTNVCEDCAQDQFGNMVVAIGNGEKLFVWEEHAE